MVKIRLARAGAKKRAFFHIVATDSRNSRDGKFIERLGHYNPIASAKEQKVLVDAARLEYWKSKGAQVSDRVTFLLSHVLAKPEAAKAA